MHYFPEYAPLFTDIDGDTLILTPNRRLSRFVSTQYGLFKQGVAAWGSLKCMSLQVWLEQLWGRVQSRALHDEACFVSLASFQEKLLWQEVVRGDQGGYDLLVPDRLADVLMEAWQHLRLWQFEIEDISEETEEAVLCKRWMHNYVALTKDKMLIDTHRIAAVIIEVIERRQADCFKSLQLPKKIKLLGFDEIPPLQQSLLNNLQELGCHIEQLDIELSSSVGQIALADQQLELEAAARWALKKLQLYSKKNEVVPLIGLVIPELANQREHVEHVLQQVFEPQYILPNAPRHAPAFNISAAQNLADTPVIKSALEALRIFNVQMDKDFLSRFLLSPFFGDEREMSARAELDILLRRDYINVTPSILRACCGKIENEEGHGLAQCPDMYQRLHELHEHARKKELKKYKPSEWVGIFQEQLVILGWPGSRTLDTLEFQQAQIWPEVLERFAQLELIMPSLDRESALKHLASLASVPFQAQTRQSPIQVLGLLEAAGLQFDYLWVMGMDNRNWPEAPNPNSLLPTAFQRENAMPRSSAEKEFNFAQRLTQRLSQSAGEVVFSWSKLDEDQELRPSALIQNLTIIEFEMLELAELHSYSLQSFRERVVESLLDVQAPAVGGRVARGGTQILKDQAACGFKAFAKHRLAAKTERESEIGVDGIQKGNLIHRALEIIWAELKDQRALLSLLEADLDALIVSSIHRAWSESGARRQVGKKLQALELDRAAALIRAWMELEKQRPDFVVAFNETQRDLVLGGLKMRIRYDRVDRLVGDQSLVVIDYKTSEVDPKDWAGDRPSEPQVPIYCVAQADEVQAAAFGQLHVAGVAFKGLTNTDYTPKGLVLPENSSTYKNVGSWEVILQSWQETLTKLANDYLAGQAIVDPKSPEACRFCDLHGLCRIREVSEQREITLLDETSE